VLSAIYIADNRQHIVFRRPAVLGTIILIAFIAIDISFAQRVRTQAKIASVQIEQLTSFFGVHLPADNRVLIDVGSKRSGQIVKDALKIGYSLSPRPSLLLPTMRYDDDQYESIVERFHPDVLLLMRDSELHRNAGYVIGTKVSDLPGYFSDYSLYTTR
jgi:hypothetical protein